MNENRKRGIIKNKILTVIAIASLISGGGKALASGIDSEGSLHVTEQMQLQTARGIVADQNGEPIIGASILEKGTANGIITDKDGKFSLNVKKGAILVISYIGYKTQEVKASTNMNITLLEDAELLDEVVVIGYGVQKKKLVTGATVQVKGEDIAKLNTIDVLGALQSQSPGVNITSNGGFLGQGFKVNIRGIGTNGSYSPLYVVDGVVNGSIDGLSPADIESIDVLKDAASSAIPDPTYLTHINYAFAELYIKNGVYEKFDLQGERERFNQVKKLKERNADLKILLSFTNSVSNSGNSQDGGFSALAKSPEMRQQFAQDCKQFVQKEGIDGIDIDWEFPGMTFGSNVYDEMADVDNFTLLMKDLRETLGNSILLTYAGYCKNKQPQNEGWKYIDVKAVDPYVDFVNIMTYDLASAPGHQSPLNKPSAYWDCKRSVDEYLNAGVPAGKLVLGIPFYGRAHFDSGGSINFKNIVNLSESEGYVIDNWDEEGSVPYVTKDGVFYCGYDNPQSIALKGEWILGLGMKGLMSWDYDGDDNKGTLRKALWNAVMKK